MNASCNAERVELDGSETLVRYVGGAHIDPGTRVINGSAFDRTAKDVDGLSFSRRRILAVSDDADRDAIRRVTGSRLRLGKTAVFAELRVRSIRDGLEEFGQPIAICADPLVEEDDRLANPAHALLIGIPFVGEQLGSLKSELAGDRLAQRIEAWFPATKAIDDAS